MTYYKRNPWQLFEDTLKEWLRRQKGYKQPSSTEPPQFSFALCAQDHTMVCVHNWVTDSIHPLHRDVSMLQQDDWIRLLFPDLNDDVQLALLKSKACPYTLGVPLLEGWWSELRFVRMHMPGIDLLAAVRKANPTVKFELLPFGNLQGMKYLNDRMTWTMVAALFAAHAYEFGPLSVTTFLKNIR